MLRGSFDVLPVAERFDLGVIIRGPLAWLWAFSPRAVPIPGCRTVAQVEENAGALAHGPLAPAELAQIEQLMGRV